MAAHLEMMGMGQKANTESLEFHWRAFAAKILSPQTKVTGGVIHLTLRESHGQVINRIYLFLG